MSAVFALLYCGVMNRVLGKIGAGLRSLLKKGRSLTVGGATIEIEPGFREVATIKYHEAAGKLSLNAEWLGWGKGQTSYLLVTIPEKVTFGSTAAELPESRVADIAGRIFEASSELGVPNQMIRLLQRIPFSDEAIESTLQSAKQEMLGLGFEVIFDRQKRVMRQSRAGEYRKLTKDELMRVIQITREAGEALRGYRTPYNVLFESPQVQRTRARPD